MDSTPDEFYKIGPGLPTGLHDSNGKMIRVGDVVRMDCTGDKEFHGAWIEKVVALRGIVPVLLYQRSEKGEQLPPGYTGSPLSDYYDAKMFMFATNLSDVLPCDIELVVVREWNQSE